MDGKGKKKLFEDDLRIHSIISYSMQQKQLQLIFKLASWS